MQQSASTCKSIKFRDARKGLCSDEAKMNFFNDLSVACLARYEDWHKVQIRFAGKTIIRILGVNLG